MSRGAGEELYDSACELLYAAQELRRSAAAGGHGEVVPATLGCVTEALAQIASAAEALRSASAGDAVRPARAHHTSPALDELVRVLDAARIACERARTQAVGAAQEHPTASSSG